MSDLPPLPVHGYTSQSADKVALVNRFKQIEGNLMAVLNEMQNAAGMDPRCAAVAKTYLEIGFMYANRAVFAPKPVPAEIVKVAELLDLVRALGDKAELEKALQAGAEKTS